MDLSKITSRFVTRFPGDFSGNTLQRQTPGYLFATVDPVGFKNIELIDFNKNLSREIGLGDFNDTDINFLGATNLPFNVKTYSTAYAGHQFGNWAGQLGDGRAIYAGEVFSEKQNKFHELQWKGAGATPYSRNADGRAVLRSSIREYLMSEAMHHLNVPTTRALSLVSSGEQVLRDIAYDGNPKYEKGAVVLRVAESFLRFGHFELLAARGEFDLMKDLADFSIDNYFPEIDKDSSNKYLNLFKEIANRTLTMIIDWYRVGFVHGVMNTDNMSILGITIDYGPFSMMDNYNLEFTPNTTDLPGGRYAFGKQGQIAHWNLMQLANAFSPIVNDNEALSYVLDDFASQFWNKHDLMLSKKFGFDSLRSNDDEFFTNWQQLMQDTGLDYTIFFKQLESFSKDIDVLQHFEKAIYRELNSDHLLRLRKFLTHYLERLSHNIISITESKLMMKNSNPKFILRNYLLFNCIEAVERGDYKMFNDLKKQLTSPYEILSSEFCQKRPPNYDSIIGCSLLSCSS